MVGLSETWLSNNILDNLLTIDGYVLIRMDRPTRGGGVAVYLRSGLRYEHLRGRFAGFLEELVKNYNK